MAYFGEPTKIITGKEVIPLSRGFRDLDISFMPHPHTTDVATKYNDQAIKQSLKNLVLTTPGEKFYNQNYGCRVYQLLFEPMDAFLGAQIRDEILNTIGQFDERVRVIDVDIVADYDQHSFSVDIVYQVVGQSFTEELSFILEKPLSR